MTAPQTAETLQANELVGFNLAMAREGLCGAIVYRDSYQVRRSRVLSDFVRAMREATFGPNALQQVHTAEEATKAICFQLGFVASQEALEAVDIAGRLEGYAATATLPEAMEYTIEDVVGPLLWAQSIPA